MSKLLYVEDGVPVIKFYDRGVHYTVDMESLRALKANDKYVDAYMLSGKVLLLSISIRNLIWVLKDYGYVQVHRGAIVKRNAIASTVRVKGNVHVLVHGIENTIPVSAVYVKRVREIIKVNSSAIQK